MKKRKAGAGAEPAENPPGRQRTEASIMKKAKVYFTDFRTRLDVSQGVKLQNLCRTAGLGKVDFDGKFAAL